MRYSTTGITKNRLLSRIIALFIKFLSQEGIVTEQVRDQGILVSIISVMYLTFAGERSLTDLIRRAKNLLIVAMT